MRTTSALVLSLAVCAVCILAPGVARAAGADLVQPGTPPPCGDVNGDQDLDISDAVFLLMHLFRNGEPPRCSAEAPPPPPPAPTRRDRLEAMIAQKGDPVLALTPHEVFVVEGIDQELLSSDFLHFKDQDTAIVTSQDGEQAELPVVPIPDSLTLLDVSLLLEEGPELSEPKRPAPQQDDDWHGDLDYADWTYYPTIIRLWLNSRCELTIVECRECRDLDIGELEGGDVYFKSFKEVPDGEFKVCLRDRGRCWDGEQATCLLQFFSEKGCASRGYTVGPAREMTRCDKLPPI
ncbi:MAG: hypothetical protein HY721_33600 [Planctomycetes bacterium]|nr:hypothetical protein [Planctomycetota bacterium]